MHRTLTRIAPLALGAVALIGSALPAAAQEYPAAFTDDFSSNQSGWLQYSKQAGVHAPADQLDYAVGYASAGYYIFDNRANDWQWSGNFAVQKMNLTDETFEVDATKGHGPDASTGYGIACRLHGDLIVTSPESTSFYALIVTGDGQAGLAKVIQGQWTGLAALAANPAVNAGDATNHLRLECIGDTITAAVNGQVIGSVQDADIADGGVGLWAGTQEAPGAGIVFNRAVVGAPSA